MKKRIISLALLLIMALGLGGCSASKAAKMEDTNINALKFGNLLSAEQGEWLAMVSEGKDGAVLQLYNKKSGKADTIVEAYVYQVGMLDKKVYYKRMDDNALFCYDILKKENEKVLEEVLYYQVRDGVIYYTTYQPEKRIYTYEPAAQKSGRIDVSYAVKAFWLGEETLYYINDEHQLLMRRPLDQKQDYVVQKGKGELIRDVAEIGNGNLLFLFSNEEETESTLCRYDAKTKKVTRYLQGAFDHFNYVRGHAVAVISQKLYAVNPASDEIFIWGELPAHDQPQLWSDCVVIYNGSVPSIQFYPDETAPKE